MSAPTAPTGVLLGTFEPGTKEWAEARAGLTITATEIAAVLGLSPWMSTFTLWHKKAGLPTAPFESNPAVEWGVRLEPAVAAKYADEHGVELQTTGTWRHAEREWQRATPDRIAPDRLVEIKTSPFGDGWGPAGSDEFPLHYRCQAMWQMDVTGYRRTDLAVLIGGWDYREYVIEYDATDARVMREAAERFLDDVRRGVRPAIDGATDTYNTIRVQPDGLDDVDVEIPLQLAADYEIAQQQHKAADGELVRARGLVLDAIGNGHRAVTPDGRRIAYRTVHPDGTTRSLMPYQQKDAA